MTTTTEHIAAEAHKHTHGPNCGHEAVIHFDHVDYIHDGHAHREHDGHYDECTTCPCLRVATTRVSRSIRRCWETSGWGSPSSSTSCPTVCSRMESRCTMAARTGFASALKRLLTGSYSATFVPDILLFLYANVCIANHGEAG